jgi:competence protein ComEC
VRRSQVTDLRLAPAALTCWGAGWWVTGGSAHAGRTLATGSALVAFAVACLAVHRPLTTRWTPSPCLTRVRVLSRGTAGVALAAGTAGLLLVATSAQLAARDAAGLQSAAAQGAVVTVVGTVDDDPIPVLSPWGGDPLELVGIDADVVSHAGRAVRAAAPILIEGDAAWANVPVGERLVVVGRLRTADPGEREVADLTPTRAAVRLAAPHGPVAAADALRSRLMAVTDSLSPQARALVPGVAVGDVTRLDPDLAAAMKTVGLTHVTAVSGGHFAIVVAALTGVCALARLGRWWRLAVLAPATAGFVLLVRPDPSVVRSAAMCACTLGALALARPARALPALATSVIVLLVCDPWLARSYGFVLSTAATAGIVLGAGPLARRLAAWMPRHVALALAVPVVAQAACGPVLVLLAPAVGTYAVPANLLAEPALVPATLLGVLATLVAPWWSAGAHLVAVVAGWATWWIATTATTFASLPGASLAWAPGPGGALLLLVATVAATVALWNWRAAARLAGVQVPWERGAGPPWRVRSAVSAARGRLRACLPRPARRSARHVPPRRRAVAESSRSRT